MTNLDTLMKQHRWRWVDHSASGKLFQPLQSFAFDDTFCYSVGSEQSDPVLRAWVHRPTIVLGIQDSRLPHIQSGISYLHEQGYDVIVRNSGGLAVVLDEGILNLSMIVKEKKQFTIDLGYEWMYELVRHLFSDAPNTIEAYEVVGSYCPGKYDLSINGKKFAGLSQRRLRGGAAVQIYLCLNKSGAKRAALLRTFYELAVQGKPVKYTWPLINPNVMASLSDIYGEKWHTTQVVERLLRLFTQKSDGIYDSSLSEDEMILMQEQFQRVVLRNDKALEQAKSSSSHHQS